MAKTPLLSALQLIYARMASAQARGLPPEASLGGKPLSRRELVKAAGVAAAGLVLAPRSLAASESAAPKIVVVGGGLSGLVAAWRLAQCGVPAKVYEASTRVGGRVHTNYTTFQDGQRVERGGELIDSGHKQYRKLIKELGFKLDNLLNAEPNGSEALYYFDGEPYTEAQAAADFAGVFQALHQDVQQAGYPTLYNAFNAAGHALDQMSIVDWIESRVPGGMASKLGRLLAIAYDIEYGAAPDLQSSLNLVYLLGFGSTPGNFSLFGESDERFRVKGGNDQVPSKLGTLLGSKIKLQHKLVAAATQADGDVRLTFDTPSGTKEVTAERVIMTVPFSVLRASVDISQLELKPLKRTAIEQIGMGTNTKLHVQFTTRPWYALGNNGETVADTGYQNTWEETRAQAGAAGILVDYTGSLGTGFATGTPGQHAAAFLSQIEPVLPGLSARWNGLASVDYWTGSPFQKGSYSYWKVAQYTQFAGVEGEVEGKVHFAGEHTSISFQGFMEGAVETGERAADEVLEAI